MKGLFQNIWRNIRRLSGDDAYERYLVQFAEHQQVYIEAGELGEAELQVLSKKEFFKQWQDGKWKGIKRCC